MARLTVAIALGLAMLAPAQAADVHNTNGWLMYFGDHPVGKSGWGVHLEGQVRRSDTFLKWQQILLRPAVNFQTGPKTMLTAGYGFVQTYRYGDAPVASAFPEHRIFEQTTVILKFANLDWQNRFRLEQRYLGVMAPAAGGGFERAAWRHENRFRYMARTSIPLRVGDGKNYIGIYDEIFFNFGRNVGANTFDQNRAYIAFGRNIGRETRFEVGFLEQTLQQRSGLVFEHNHTIQAAVFSRLPF
jgi:hypothetical protein